MGVREAERMNWQYTEDFNGIDTILYYTITVVVV